MVPVVLIIACVLPSLLWVSAVGNPLYYFSHDVPAGQLPYVLSKLAGLYAVAFFPANLGLMFHWSPIKHKLLGTLVATMVGLHIALFMTATSIRSGHLTLHLLLPRFTSGYYNAIVSVGAVAMYCLIFVIAIGATMRMASEYAARKRLHYILVLALTPLVVLHSYAIGSETNTILVLLFYFLTIGMWLKGLVLLIKGK